MDIAELLLVINSGGDGGRLVMGEAQAGMAGLRAESDRTTGSLGNLAATFAKVGVAVGAIAAVIGVVSVKMAADLQKTMMLVRTQAHDTTDNLDQMTQQVVKLSTEVGVSADKLAEGLYHVTSVGYRGAEAMQILRIAAEGAKVGNADLDSTTYALTSTMQTYGLTAKDAQSTMATLNAIVGAGDMRFQDLNAAISTGFLAAGDTFGVSIQSMGAALAYLTDRGASADESATRLKMSINLLGAPTSKAVGILKDLGLSAEEATGRATAMEEALRKSGVTTTQLSADLRKPDGIQVALTDLVDHMHKGGLSADEMAAVLSRAFGGGRSGAAIMSMVEHLDILGNKFDTVNAGASRFGKDWEDTQKTFSFQLDHLKTNVEALALRLGTALLPAVTAVVTYLADHIGVVEGWIDGLGRMASGAQNFLRAFGIGTTTVGAQAANASFRAGEHSETGGQNAAISQSPTDLFRAGERGDLGSSGVTSAASSASTGKQTADLAKQIARTLMDAFREAVRSVDWVGLGKELARDALSFMGTFLDNLGWAGQVTKALVVAFVALKIAMAVEWVYGFAAAIGVVNAEQGGLVLTTRLLRIEWAATRIETAAIAALYAWDWITANAKVVASFVVAKAQIIAWWVVLAVESAVNAAKTAAAWVAAAATSATAWVAEKVGAVAVTIASFVATAVEASVNAVKAAAAWVAASVATAAGWVRTAAIAIASYVSTAAAANPNSNAALIVWVATQIKIAAGWVATAAVAVASFVSTAVGAVVNAARTVLAWMVAWVTLQAAAMRYAAVAIGAFVATRAAALLSAAQTVLAWMLAWGTLQGGAVRTQVVAVGSFVATRVAAVVNAAGTAAAWVGANLAMLVATMRTVAGMTLLAVWGGIVRLATLAWMAAQWLLDAALAANPIGLVIVAIALLVAGIIWAYQNVGWFHDAVNKAWEILQRLGGWIKDTLWPLIRELGDKFGELKDRIVDAVQSFARQWIDNFAGAFNGALSLFRDFIGAINGILKTFGAPEIKIEGIFKTGVDGGAMKKAVGLATGGMITNGPHYVVGEGNPAYPEVVLPTDPAHRGRAMDLLGWFSKAIGLAAGGLIGNNPYPDQSQCTAYVWERFGGKIPADGNAKDWVTLPLKHESAAAPGLIAVFSGGPYGHVAVVESGADAGGSFDVSDRNWLGPGVTGRHRMGPHSYGNITFLNPGVRDVGGAASGTGPDIGFLVDAALGLAQKGLDKIPEWLRGVAGGVLGKMAEGAKAKLASFGTARGPSGAVTGDHATILHAAEKIAGVGSDWDSGLDLIIQHESGWSTTARNSTDINAQVGNASVGLGQLTGSNRAKYDPDESAVGQVVGIIRYVLARYGGIGNVPGVRSVLSGHGYVPYDSGGMLMPGLTMALNNTGRPETVLPPGAGLSGEGAAALGIKLDRTNDLLYQILTDSPVANGFTAGLRAG